jgi:hypothetical protein
MAQSTALRFRNRERVDSIDSFLDSIGNLGGIVDRTLTETIDVTEVSWATEISKRVGDKIESFSDGETYSIGSAGVRLGNTEYPEVASIGEYTGIANTNHSGNHPAVTVSGQLLLYFVTIWDANDTGALPSITDVSDLTVLLTPAGFPNIAADPVRMGTGIWYKRATGSEGGTTFNISVSVGSQPCVAHCFAIDNWNSGESDNPTYNGQRGENISAIISWSQPTPSWAPKNTLWIPFAYYAREGGQLGLVTTWDDDYPDNRINATDSGNIGHVFFSAKNSQSLPDAARIDTDVDVSWANLLIAITNSAYSQLTPVTDALVIEKSQSIVLFDSVPVVTDAGFITDKDLIRQRVLSDSLSVADSFNKSVTTTPSVINFRSLSDSLSTKDFEAGNAIVLNKRRPVDTLLVTDKIQKTITIVLPPSTIYDRIEFDDVVLTDSIDATITRGQAQSTIYSRVRTSALEVTDAAAPTFIGITVKTISESIAVNDFTEAEYPKVFIESLDTSDQSTELRIRPRVVSENIAVTEKILVERTEIINTVTISESIAATDRFDATYIQFVQVSAEIVIGIEVQ